MNRFLSVFLLLIATNALLGQSKMVSFFNMLSKEDKHEIEIKQKNGNFIAMNVGLEAECGLILDDKNGFLQITDNGTGGGTSTIQLAQFKDASGNVTLALSLHTYDGVMHESKLNFFNPNNKMQEVTGKVFDFDIPSGAFQKSDYQETSENEDYISSEYFYYELPREGLVLKMFHGYNRPEMECRDEKKKSACEFMTHFAPFLPFKWNKAEGKFEQM